MIRKNIFIGIIFLLAGCGKVPDRNNVYKRVSLGSHFQLDILKSASQIINKKDLILVYDISEDLNKYAPHLLFYNEELKLYAANYFSSEKVESIKNGRINAIVNRERYCKSKYYKSDLPSNYSLNYSVKGGITKRMSNKIIEKINLDSFPNIEFFVKESADLYKGVGKSIAYRDSIFFSHYTYPKNYSYSLEDLIFDSKNGTIMYCYLDTNNILIRDYMILKELSVLHKFYTQLYQKIRTKYEKGIQPRE